MENKDFVAFIITNGRPNDVVTFTSLKKAGYTGKIYFILDNEDKTIQKYQDKFGIENIFIFDKLKYANEVDEGDNFDERRTTTHARNASFDIAKKLNIKYFIQLDDDYTAFHFRYIEGDKLLYKPVVELDFIFDVYLEYYKSTNFKSIAFAQGGDFIGGAGNKNVINRPLMRKCMNSFICSTERPFQFIGSHNEDVNAYVVLGSRGQLFGTVPMINLVQKATQVNKGAISDKYKIFGTYYKSFMTLMMHPSGVKVSILNSNNPRIHHLVRWINTVPVIINEKYKK